MQMSPISYANGCQVVAVMMKRTGEILEHLYPRGKVPLMDMDKLLELTIEMLQNPAPVPVARAFGLRESMQKHLDIYQQLAGTRPC